MKSAKVLIFFFFFLPVLAFSQVIDQIDVRLNVLEKVGNKTRPLPNAKLFITDQGNVETDQQGRYQFVYPVRNNVDPRISVSLVSDKYKALKPLDASVDLNPDREEIFIEFLVVDMSGESDAFKKRVRDLESTISRLRAKDQLTRQQLNALNTKLLDTIMHFEGLRQDLEARISDFQHLTEAQKQEIDALTARNAELEEERNRLVQELEVALEARYLRQNEYYKAISSNLLAYVREAKDVLYHFSYIKAYYAQGSYANMHTDNQQYSEEYAKFRNNYFNNLEGVEHYWENEAVSKNMEEAFELLESIHLNQLYPVLSAMLEEIGNYRPQKAQKIADENREILAENLRGLEMKINRILRDMRNNQ